MSFLSRYHTLIRRLIDGLRKRHFYTTAMILGTLLSEPIANIRTALYFRKGKKKAFHYFGMNQVEKPLGKSPILMVHGNLHNQSAWLELGKAFKENGIGPLFTLNVSFSEPLEKGKSAILEKIEEVSSLYPKNPPKIHLIGHSRGALLCMMAAVNGVAEKLDKGGRISYKKVANWNPFLGKLFRLGNPLSESEREWMPKDVVSQLYEIDGSRDLIVHDKSMADTKHKLIASCGHLGLLYSPEVHRYIIQLIKAEKGD